VLVRAILAMARSQNLRSLAEGVENEEQARFLIDEGCDEIQGFLVGAPLAPAEFARFLERDKAENDFDAQPESEPDPSPTG
jgi:EAL domain-containing protein (putative c-di-GMP-specific phosphodiesterase class I)